MSEHYAIEVRTEETFELAKAIEPGWGELDYETEIKGRFLVFGFPENGSTSLMPVETFYEHFDHIENGPQITFKRFVKLDK